MSRQIDSASPGSFRYRYSSALAIASGMAALEIGLRFSCIVRLLSCLPSANLSKKPRNRIVMVFDYALLQRDDCVVCDVNIFRTDLCAALGDVAEADAEVLFEQLCARQAIQRMHFET